MSDFLATLTETPQPTTENPSRIIPEAPGENAARLDRIRAAALLPLPTESRDCYSLWRDCYSLQKSGIRLPRDEQKVVNEFRGRLCAHIKASQNLVVVDAYIGANEQSHQRNAHRSRPAARADRLARLNAAIAVPVEKTALALPRQSDPIRQQLADDPVLQVELMFVVRDLQVYDAHVQENFSELFPTERLEELKPQIMSAVDAKARQALRDELLVLTNPHASEFATAARREALAKWETCRAGLVSLFTGASDRVQEWKADSALDEAAFFESHGLKPEATSVTRRFDRVVKELAHQIEQASALPLYAGIPRVEGRLGYFGIADILR